MRIRGSSMTSPSSTAPNSPSSSTPSSLTSLASFQSNCSSSSSLDYQTRCEGLDLLVEAVLHVAGSVLGVPFTQRRVIRRRKRVFEFSKFIFNGLDHNKEKKDEEIEVISKQKRRKREMGAPSNSKYQDSVIQPWRRSNRRRQSVVEIDDPSG